MRFRCSNKGIMEVMRMIFRKRFTIIENRSVASANIAFVETNTVLLLKMHNSLYIIMINNVLLKIVSEHKATIIFYKLNRVFFKNIIIIFVILTGLIKICSKILILVDWHNIF